ncbi:cation:proton antiporter [Micromonospora sp. RTGN7]|uniref:cation:proton antiporter n=1 Tax=Micromonospora sp. RTGN7 TaxID=3016526 RepID=UPI0029FF51DD|nr:cation:proton antiporter [Micromonospora sp. RTGN7]
MTPSQISSLFLALALIVLLSHLCGRLARRVGQPAVIGEVLLGVLLGPTLLHGFSQTLFPTDVRPFLAALANLGVALFMFGVGAELDSALLRGRRVIAGAVSSGSIALPFALGAGLAYYLMREHPTENQLGFVLFMGAAMSVTAFPVLARILTDRGMIRTWLGSLALACAAIDDVLAWTLLAVVVAISGAAAGGQWLLLLFVPYLIAMVYIIRPALRRLLRQRPGSDPARTTSLVVVLVGLLASGAFTEWIGLHFIFGAFLFGTVMPRDALRLPDRQFGVTEQIGHLNGTLLLPIFFIVTGLKVDLSGFDRTALVELLLILAVAIGGKFVGAYVAARLSGLRNRPATALATLMNTRGLTELIILTVGLQLGVLDVPLYSSMVVMALVTTAMAGPLLQLIYPLRAGHPEAEVAEVQDTEPEVAEVQGAEPEVAEVQGAEVQGAEPEVAEVQDAEVRQPR